MAETATKPTSRKAPAAAALVLLFAAASFYLGRLSTNVSAAPAAPVPAAEEPTAVVEEEPVKLVRPNLVDLPPLPDGWVYAYDADVGYIIAHPESWKIANTPDVQGEGLGRLLVSDGGNVVLEVDRSTPRPVRDEHGIEIIPLLRGLEREGKPISGSTLPLFDVSTLILPYDGHAGFEGKSYMTEMIEGTVYVIRAYSLTGKYYELEETVEEIVKSLRVLR